jgi:hypothetical protein
MASQIEGLGFPRLTSRHATGGTAGRTNRFAPRLQDRLLKLVEAWRSRDAVRDSLPLAHGERVLTLTCDGNGEWAAATERALYHCGGEPSGRPPEWVRLGWEEIGNVSWDERECTLTVAGLLPTLARRTVLHLPNGTALGRLAHERVTWTSLVRTEVTLGEHGRARVIGRRQPGSDELVWLIGVDGPLDTPGLQATLETALGELRRDLGL